MQEIHSIQGLSIAAGSVTQVLGLNSVWGLVNFWWGRNPLNRSFPFLLFSHSPFWGTHPKYQHVLHLESQVHLTLTGSLQFETLAPQLMVRPVHSLVRSTLTYLYRVGNNLLRARSDLSLLNVYATSICNWAKATSSRVSLRTQQNIKHCGHNWEQAGSSCLVWNDTADVSLLDYQNSLDKKFTKAG